MRRTTHKTRPAVPQNGGDAPPETAAIGRPERRRDRRLPLRLPIECRRRDAGRTTIVRTVSRNICPGGMQFELDGPDFDVGDRIDVDISVPAGEGVSDQSGRVACRAEIIRVAPLDGRADARLGLAARFLDRLRLSF